MKVYTSISVCSLNTLDWDLFWQVFTDFRSFDMLIWNHSALLAAKLTENNTKLSLYEVSTQKRKFRYPVVVNTNPKSSSF